MERKQANSLYKHSLDYFIQLVNNNAANCAIIVVYKENIPISTELLLLSTLGIYSFLGGTDPNYFNTRPNDFLKTEVLKWGHKRGYKHYFLGGGKDYNDSLYKYKKDFFPSDEDVIFYTGRKIIDKEVYKKLVISHNPLSIGCKITSFFPLYRCQQKCFRD